MQDQITDGDIEILCAANPMASEQLRRIVAERQRAELLAEVADLTTELATMKGRGIESAKASRGTAVTLINGAAKSIPAEK